MITAVTTAPVAAQLISSGVASATTPTYTFFSGGVTVKTHNNTSWLLSAVYNNDGGTGSVGVQLTRTVSSGGTGGEDVLWSFDSVSASDFKFTASTGVGSLDTGTALSPEVTSLDLSFKSTKTIKDTCTTGSETTYDGSVKGELVLVTGLTNGGTVGSKTLTFGSSPSPSVKVDSSCVTATNDCTNGFIWVSAATASVEADGGAAGFIRVATKPFVGVVDTAKLSKPADSERLDIAEVAAANPTYDTSTKTVSITSSSAGIITGSATISGGKVTSTSFPCSYAGKKYTGTELIDETGKYESPSGKSITAHMSLLGSVVVANDANQGFYIKDTFKLA
jgi:hypothetical protein